MDKKILLLLLIIFFIGYHVQSQNYNRMQRMKCFEEKAKRLNQILINDWKPSANQEEFNVKYYCLDISPDPSTSVLSGSLEIISEVLSTSLNYIELNFASGMNIDDIRLSGFPGIQLEYTHADDTLNIELDRAYMTGEQFSLVIEYNGRPQESLEFGWGFGFSFHANQPMIWSFSQPWGARAWWPCKDVPSDKADSMDINVTVPTGLIVASNGFLQGIDTLDSFTTYQWHEKYPIATYLVSVAIYPYDVHYDDYIYNDGADTMKIHFYTFPGNYDLYVDINTKVKDMIAYFAELFGEYPFVDEKYGQADFTEGGAVEHQTCTSYHFWNESLFAHEIAHQWWGDMITYDSWHHTWLSEGLAVYCEALWYEQAHGPGTASDFQMKENLYFGGGTVYVEDPETITDISDNPFYPPLIYQKASWVFHMLRHIVGNDTFFQILRTIYASPEYRYGTITTAGFQEVCEQVTGTNFEKFFHQWIYEEYVPIYFISWDYTPSGSDYIVDLNIDQLQANHIFWMPLDVTITTNDGESTFKIVDSLPSQSFQLGVSSPPLDVELDKDNWVLKKVEEEFIDPSFDKGILLVNGVNIDIYGSEIIEAYEDSAFWGDFPVAFWDCFEPPAAGYPSTLTNPLGYGKIPVEILSQYSTLIWIGNDYYGDLRIWEQTSIIRYLEAGGNVMLLTRHGYNFIHDEKQEYLGLTWVEQPSNTIQNCIAAFPHLSDMSFAGNQTGNAVFDTTFSNAESRLLFTETESFGTPRGLGVWRKPVNGGIYKSNGGHFIFISGRPYRYNHNHLKANIEYMLEYFLDESVTGKDPIQYFRLEQNYPNPFNSGTTILYTVKELSKIKMTIYNLLGEKIIELVNEMKTPDIYTETWDGKNSKGKQCASGIYFYRISSDKFTNTKKMILIR